MAPGSCTGATCTPTPLTRWTPTHSVPSQPPKKPTRSPGDNPCADASQWRRTQFAANDANEPCVLTALIGYEWTASPSLRHCHRNGIFRSAKVPDRAADYIHYPQVTSLWRGLAAHCHLADGCDVITTPHNINRADGGPTFDVENASHIHLEARARYERLAKIHQEKGNSECPPEDRKDSNPDCGFERRMGNAANGNRTVSKRAWSSPIWNLP